MSKIFLSMALTILVHGFALADDNLQGSAAAQIRIAIAPSTKFLAFSETTALASDPPSPDDETLRLEGRKLRDEGLAALRKNNFAVAAPKLERALEIQRKLHPTDQFPKGHFDLSEAIFDVSCVYMFTKRSVGEQMCRESLEMLRRVEPAGSRRFIWYLETLAMFRLNSDSFEAENLIREAMELRRKHKSPSGLPLRQLGNIYRDRQEDAKAQKYYRESVEAFRNQGNQNEVAATLTDLGGLLTRSGKHSEAEGALKEAIAILRKISPKGTSLAVSLVNLSHTYLGQNKLELALSAAEEGKDLYLAAPGGVMFPAVRYAYQQIGLIHAKRGDLQKAEDNLRISVELFRKSVQDPTSEHQYISMDMAKVLSQKGDHAAAAAITRRLLSDVIDQMDRMAGAQTEQSQLTLLQSKMYYLSNHVANCERAGISAKETYDLVLRWKGLVTRRQMLTRAAREGAASSDPVTASLFVELEDTSRKLAGLASVSESAAQNAELKKLEQRSEELEEQLSRRTDSFRRTKLATRTSAADLCKSLPRDVVFIDYLVYERTQWLRPRGGSAEDRFQQETKKEWCAVAFVVCNEAIESVWLGAKTNETEAMSRFETAVAQGRSLEGPAGVAAKQVHDYLWKPVRKNLLGAKLVLISPDQEICSVPFAALPSSDGKGYLLEEIAIAQVLVPQMLPDLLSGGAPPRSDGPSFLAIGDVDFDAATGERSAKPPSGSTGKTEVASTRGLTEGVKWSALPGTRDEIQSLEQLFKTSTKEGRIQVLRGKDATEAAFRQHAPRHRVLHVASHGFFATGEEASKHAPGLRVGLVFAGANNRNADGDDGVLTALEVANLDLSKVDLAVLSACETGLGTSTGGEGLVGLQRALQIAGARATCTSLWKVDDEATRRLMERFYDNLWNKKLGRLAALHEAQLWMLNKGKGALSESTLRGIARLEPLPSNTRADNRLPPYLWAAFTLSGDWR